MSRTGTRLGSNQLVTQLVETQADHTTANKQQRLRRAARVQVGRQAVRELRHGEDEDQIGKEFERPNALAPFIGRS